MKKHLYVFCLMLLLSPIAAAQDKTAAINTGWIYIAGDTGLTYEQIIIRCDSLFALAGYPVVMDTSQEESDEEK